MAFWHGEKGKKATGGKIHIARKKRKYELGSLPTHTKMGKDKIITVRMKGGSEKLRALSVEFANVFDNKTKTAKKVKILDVVENPANPQLVRSKIITKGAVIKTELGNARVRSRPGQHGIVNALLIEKK
ncbi:MAG TPA: 30S ribosomal protein S8e [archaeon]|nr:30S ribosomal protein S8e [archaeon]